MINQKSIVHHQDTGQPIQGNRPLKSNNIEVTDTLSGNSLAAVETELDRMDERKRRNHNLD